MRDWLTRQDVCGVLAFMVTAAVLAFVGLGIPIPDGLWAAFGSIFTFYLVSKKRERDSS